MGTLPSVKHFTAGLLLFFGIGAFLVWSFGGGSSTAEVEEIGPTEIWYEGNSIQTNSGVYFLSCASFDFAYAVFDFYPNRSSTDHSSITVFIMKRFQVGDQLYRLRGVGADYITVELLEEVDG